MDKSHPLWPLWLAWAHISGANAEPTIEHPGVGPDGLGELAPEQDAEVLGFGRTDAVVELAGHTPKRASAPVTHVYDSCPICGTVGTRVVVTSYRPTLWNRKMIRRRKGMQR